MSKSGLSFAFALITLACGPAAPDGEQAEAPTDTAGGEGAEPREDARPSARALIGINPPEQPWSEMSYADREMDMVGRFLPIFAEVFQEYDAQEYAAFNCESCHGSDMREREFAMPTNELPPVPLPNTPAYEQMAADYPEDTRFMEEVVTPTMQTMLGMGATFTCNGCHPVGS